MTDWNPALTPSFKPSEMACKCGCFDEKMQHEFMAALQALRDRIGPLQVTSGYRCPNHPAERRKTAPGAHSIGMAADIVPLKASKYDVMKHAFDIGFVGIGLEERFIHVDMGHPHAHRPAVWKY